jgi:hypothetical protein
MDVTKYEIDIRLRGKPRVGFTYVITHPNRPGWKEESADSYNSAEEAKKAGSVIVRRFVTRAAR